MRTIFKFQILLFFIGLLSCSNQELPQSVSFGVCADVHKDLMHDADERLFSFVKEMNQKHVDFTIQLGDFCRPYAYNDTFMNIWNSFEGPNYHVLGNHDMDGGFNREETGSYWGMPAKYYSFNLQGFHFIVLDGNDHANPPQAGNSGNIGEEKDNWPPPGGYPRYIGEEQKNWLISDLSSTNLPSVIFSHQSLEDEWGIENAQEIRSILEKENQNAGEQKILACFNGHSHLDTAIQINDIWYVEINSMSYVWVGEKHKHSSYSATIHENYPWLECTCPYEDPLYAVVTIDSDGQIIIEGRKSKWVGPSPSEVVGYNDKNYYDRVKPKISNVCL